MKEYIEREPLIKQFSGGDKMKSMTESIHDSRFVDVLKKAPTADVAPVVHAYWTGLLPTDYAHAEGFADWFTEEDKKAYIDMFEHITHCSNCKGVFDDRTIKDWRHCPYCGATMDGVNNSRND